METKKIVVNIILSAIIHIAFFAFLFSFRGSKPLPATQTNVPFATIVSPRRSQQTADVSQSQQKKQSLPPEEKISHNSERFIPVSENNEAAETSENNTNKIAEISENFNDFLGDDDVFSSEKVQISENSQIDSPKPLYMPKIPYPRAAKTAKIEGIAEISYTIDTTGRVVSVRFLSIPHVSFEKTIEKSVLSWRFFPAVKNGKPISISANQTIVFKLE